MQQRSEAGHAALRIVAAGRLVQPDRLKALCRAGLLIRVGRGKRARWLVTEDGDQFLQQVEP